MIYKSFGEKQLDVIKNANAFINILEGSVRSSKTVAANVRWIMHVLTTDFDKFLMSGESLDSLYRNVISEIEELFGSAVQFTNTGRGGAKLIFKPQLTNSVEKICYCRGASKANAEGAIRGMTIAGWYGDEITLHHRTFINQAINRMSVKGAIALWTTNPDSPFHPVKTEYIDKAEEKRYKHWHFSLEDNPYLNPEFVTNLKKSYTGLFFDRFIKGLWKRAEGTIYNLSKANIVKTKQRDYTSYYISIDYGTQNPFAAGLWGKYRDKWIKIDEYYYDGRKQGISKTDSEYKEDLELFVSVHNLTLKKIPIIVDPSATSFITELEKAGYQVIRAKNSVLEGIRNHMRLLKNRKILYNDICKETFKEFDTYIWDEKAQSRGEDKPLKENDHCMDADRYFTNTILNNSTMISTNFYSG